MISGLLYHNGESSWILSKLLEDGFNYKELIFDYKKVSRIGDKKSREFIVKNF